MGSEFAHFVIIGSGVAGSACLEELLLKKLEYQHIIMVSSSCNMKVASSYRHVGRLIQKVSLTEQNGFEYMKSKNNFTFIQDSVVDIFEKQNYILTKNSLKIFYDRLIICSGSIPKLIFNNPLVYTLRDIDSIKRFKNILSQANDVCIIGNGGIALELVYEIKNCNVHWVIKSENIGSAFFDTQTSKFFDNLKNVKIAEKSNFYTNNFKNIDSKDIYKPSIDNIGNDFFNQTKFNDVKKDKLKNDILNNLNNFTISDKNINNHPVYKASNENIGCAVGPNWNQDILLSGSNKNCLPYPDNIKIYYKSNIVSIDSYNNRTRVETEKGDIIECDVVILAIGVKPNTEFLNKIIPSRIKAGDKGGIIVNEKMQSSVVNVYAAGDCAELRLAKDGSISKWFQMHLWSQAMYMGIHAANCIIDPKIDLPIQFELFTHLTNFFGFKICLLGLYNLQGIEDVKTISYYRFDEREFVRVSLLDGKIVGAVLIGDTEMEETIENLILSEIDVSPYGEDIINPRIDICDYFD